MGTRDAMVQAGPIEWWQTGVIYHIYLRSFKDTSGDGVGDLRGIIEQLDYLGETLGVDALWVSPFYPSPQKDFGYDISDFTAVDPLFGDLATFDALVGQMHRRALKLIIDYVPNHTSDQHPWFTKSRASRDNPKRGWYVWADPKPDGSPPNNWTSETGGSAWAWDATTAQYYLHSHYPEQPDLNWRNPAVKAAMFDVLRFWLERGVDGFRIDVAHMIMKDPALRDNPPNPEGVPNPFDRQHPDFSAQRHVHDRRHPDLHAVYREMRALLDAYSGERPRMAIGEIEVMPWDDWIAYFGAELDELHLPFNFGLIETPWTASAIRASVDALERALPAGAWPNYGLGNHDRARLASREGPEQARVAAMLLLTLRGTPTLYYGDELGMADAPIPPALWHDSLGRGADAPALDGRPARRVLRALHASPLAPRGARLSRHQCDSSHGGAAVHAGAVSAPPRVSKGDAGPAGGKLRGHRRRHGTVLHLCARDADRTRDRGPQPHGRARGGARMRVGRGEDRSIHPSGSHRIAAAGYAPPARRRRGHRRGAIRVTLSHRKTYSVQ